MQRVVNGNHVKWTRAGVRGDERSIENERARARTCYHTGRTHARSMRTTSISKRMSLFTCWDWHQWRREARAILQALSCVHMLSLHGYWILNNEKESRMSDPTWRLITLHWRCQRHNFKHKYFFESLSVCLCACHVPAWDVNLGKERSLATMKNTYTHTHVKLPVDMFFVRQWDDADSDGDNDDDDDDSGDIGDRGDDVDGDLAQEYTESLIIRCHMMSPRETHAITIR